MSRKPTLKAPVLSPDKLKAKAVAADDIDALGSDSELVMMNLQQLMQQRNQASQLYSGMQNETMKDVIGKIG
jgi:hypothetical protein